MIRFFFVSDDILRYNSNKVLWDFLGNVSTGYYNIVLDLFLGSGTSHSKKHQIFQKFFLFYVSSRKSGKMDFRLD